MAMLTTKTNFVKNGAVGTVLVLVLVLVFVLFRFITFLFLFAAICWILYCLALHPEHQQKCRDEVESILEKGNGLQKLAHKALFHVVCYLYQLSAMSMATSCRVNRRETDNCRFQPAVIFLSYVLCMRQGLQKRTIKFGHLLPHKCFNCTCMPLP